MCRNIRRLHNFEPPATTDEIQAAALQFVRKVSGSTKPSRANEAAFARAVGKDAAAQHRRLQLGCHQHGAGGDKAIDHDDAVLRRRRQHTADHGGNFQATKSGQGLEWRSRVGVAV